MSIPLIRDSKSITAILILFGLIIIQQASVLSQDTQFGRALTNALHTPWFMAVSLGIWYLIGKVFPQDFFRRLAFYTVASSSLAILLEVTQLFNSRQASISDIGLNLMGALAALLVICSIPAFRAGRTAYVSGLLAGAMCLVTMPLYGPWSLLKLQLERDRQAPVLLQFDNEKKILLRQVEAEWELVYSPEDWPQFSGNKVGFIHLDSSSRWPGIRLIEPFSDWRDYNYIVIDAFLEGQQELLFTVRVATNSSRGYEQAIDFVMNTGPNQILIPLARLVGDRSDPAVKIRALYLTSSQQSATSGFYLGSIKLRQ